MLIDPGLRFFFIRHGETQWNREGRLQGQRDTMLDPVGRDQAAAAGRALRTIVQRHGVEHLGSLRFVVSPLTRTRDTAERARRAMGLPEAGYATDDRLKELSFGRWEGLTWPEVKAVAASAVRVRKQDKWRFVPPGDGESYAMLAERLTPWLASLRHHDVVVAHGGVARVLLHLIAGATTGAAPDLDIWQGRVMTFSHGSCHWD